MPISINIIAAVIFALALMHTFAAKAFESLAQRSQHHAGLFHLRILGLRPGGHHGRYANGDRICRESALRRAAVCVRHRGGSGIAASTERDSQRDSLDRPGRATLDATAPCCGPLL